MSYRRAGRAEIWVGARGKLGVRGPAALVARAVPFAVLGLIDVKKAGGRLLQQASKRSSSGRYIYHECSQLSCGAFAVRQAALTGF